jgi:DNA polymerase I-like protein with 3'-5' exonuclease and polymerase domains
MEKLLSAFGDELVNKISTTTNRLHASYNIAATKAGRFSSNHPNVQQIPKHRAPEFRRCIIAAPDKVLVIGDFNMMELRAAAAVSGDPMMTADFANGVDLHTQQAAMMLGIDYNDVDATARDHAKPVNFSMIYGAGAAGLVVTAWNNYGIDLSLVEAEAARNAFLTRYATYATWMRINHAQVKQRGIIEIGRLGRVIEAAWETPTAANGVRRRRAPWDDEDEDDDYDYGSNDDGFAAGSSYGWAQDLLKFTLCCNAPIQGACADASMLALLKVDAALREARIEGGPILFVHDEIVLEVRKEDAKVARRILTECMIAGFAETFPAAPLNDVVSTKVGESWGSAGS